MTARISRRRFLTIGLAAIVCGVSEGFLGSAYVTLAEPHWLQVTNSDVHLRNLPPALDGLRVALLSDLHLGPHVSVAYLRRAVAIANELAADLIVVTGDFVSQSADYSAACAGELAALWARYGVFAVLGNHDVWTNADQVAANISTAGVQVLRDNRVSMEIERSRVWLVGVEDAGTTGGSFSRFQANWATKATALRVLLEGIPPDEPRLLLVHNPDFTEMAPSGKVDLALCGHTHGGQVRLPLIGPLVVPSCFGAKYAAGLVRGPATLVYVSRGVGLTAPPVRFNCRPEIALLRLRAT